jgi:hypothetical protein
LAYILGNLTTNFEEARLALTSDSTKSLQNLIALGSYYLQRDQNPDQFKSTSKVSKYEEFTQGGLEDAMTKVIKLLANLSTEETQA